MTEVPDKVEPLIGGREYAVRLRIPSDAKIIEETLTEKRHLLFHLPVKGGRVPVCVFGFRIDTLQRPKDLHKVIGHITIWRLTFGDRVEIRVHLIRAPVDRPPTHELVTYSRGKFFAFKPGHTVQYYEVPGTSGILELRRCIKKTKLRMINRNHRARNKAA